MVWIKRIGLILLIICLGTVIDYFTHQASPYFSVPATYFSHKIFYGTLWGLVGYIIFRRLIKTHFWLAFTISAGPSVLLQVMYFIQRHLLPWVTILFLFLHFLMFLLPGYFICKRYKSIFLDNSPVSPQSPM